MVCSIPGANAFHRITSVDYKESDKSAVIHFEKPSAAKTALMVRGFLLCICHPLLKAHSLTVEP